MMRSIYIFAATSIALSSFCAHAHIESGAGITADEIDFFNKHYVNFSYVAEDGTNMHAENHDHGPAWPASNTSPEVLEALGDSGDEEMERKGRSSFPRIYQSVSIVNYHKRDGTGKRSYDDFKKQIDQLNDAYSGQEARSGKYGSAVDTNIRFKLAGVRYVANDDYFNYCTLPSIIAKSRPRYMMDGAAHLNVYVCWCQNNLGMAWLPYDSWFRQKTGEDHYALGATLHHELLPGNNFRGGLWNKGNILTHEIGHCYGLKHPYENNCNGNEASSDGISDTPRMSGNPLASCQSLRNRDSCGSQPGKDDLGNYMIATADSCRNHFTPGQVSFMQKTLRQYKPTLMKQVLPSCVAAIDNSDESPDLQPCLDGTIQTADNGRKWCRTDPDDNSVWGWACCPSGNDWENDECRQGNPNFEKPKNPGSPPKTKRGLRATE